VTDIACHGRESRMTVKLNCSTIDLVLTSTYIGKKDLQQTRCSRVLPLIVLPLRILCSAMFIGEFVKFGLVLRASCRREEY